MSILVLLLALLVALFGASAGKLPAGCEAVVVGQMYVCPPHGHAFARGDHGGWQDVGPLRPFPIRVPALLER